MPLSFTKLIQSMSPSGHNTWSVSISEDWMQGRTTYGGLSAALCLHAVQNNISNLPPLRSAQINFIGPSGGSVTITTEIMRRGKSVAYISAKMVGATGIATYAVFCFGAARESKLNKNFTLSPTVPGIEQSKDLFLADEGPTFTQHFEILLAQGDRPISGSRLSEIYLWARHKDHTANRLPALISIADLPPPAVLPMFKRSAPISSMTWMMNFLVETPHTHDGWWLLSADAEHAHNGYSSQNMGVWNSDGELVIIGRQNVAIFY